jgi:hypothetical protein
LDVGEAGGEVFDGRVRPSRIVRFAALIFGLILAGGVLEIALRIAPQIVPVKVLLHFSPELRQQLASGRFLTRDQVRLIPRDDGGPNLWILKPHGQKPYDFEDEGVVRLVTYDDMGFCNADGRYRGNTTFDIIIVGDSFTACHAVVPEDTWALRLERYVDASAYNLGSGGIGLYEYIQLLRTFGLPRSPRVVVMNVYEGNDLRDAIRFHDARAGQVTELDAATESQQDTADWKSTWPGRHSYAFNFLFALGERVGDLRKRFEEERGIDFQYDLAFANRRVAMNPANQDAIEVVNGRRLTTGEASLNVFDEALRRFVDLSKEHGFTAIVVYSPSAHTAYSDFVTFHDPSVAEPVRALSELQRTYFGDKSRELGFVFLDLTPHLRKAAEKHQEDLLYFPTTLHYTALAHDVVARVLADLLDDLGLAAATPSAASAG